MKRIAIVTSHPIQYNAPLFKLLAQEANIQIKVFYTWGEGVLKKKLDPGFGKVIEWDIPLLDGYDYTFVNNVSVDPGTHHFKGIINPTLNQEIEEWKANAVIVYGWSFVSHFKCIRYFKNKIPVIFRGDSTLLDETSGVKVLLRRLFLKWVYKKVDYFLYVGTNNKKYFLKHGAKENQLIYAPHAIDNARFAEPNSDYISAAFQWRQELGIKPEDVVILFSGKFERKKNPEYIIELSKQLPNHNLKFIFVGNGVLENSLKVAAANDNRIIFLPFTNQQKMPVVYRMADVFILPSTGPGETWGLAVNEAMASGRAVMVSDKVGGAIDLVSKENGLIFSPNDINTSVEFIKQILKDRNILAAMSEHSKTAVQSFSYKNILQGILSLVNKL
ncbi:glycosyltransferase family 4 protein [Ferruginibacter sp. SUN002]|uniref:glycosyltransferase family 4 protein n=1 Tax=Ferruginibacter sp. SUN002 TaxID=2937789 RepID=UPI003D3679BA